MSQFTVLPQASITASNPSVGVNGNTIPADSTLVGAEDQSGNLQPLQVDSSGNLKVAVESSPTPQNVNLTQVGGSAISEGQKTMAASLPVVIASDQSDVSVKQATAANLNATVVQGTATNLKTQANTYDGSGNAITSTGSALDVNLKTSAASNISTNVAQFGGNAVVTGVGGSGSGIPRVTVANDSNVIVSQSTAASLNATIVGLGTAGTPSGGVVSIQGVTSGQAVPISGTVTATNSANANTGGAVPAQATQVGGSDGTNLRALSVNTSGQLNINNISGTITLPTGAATAANQTNASQKTQVVDGSGNVIASTSNALNVSVKNASIPVTKTGTAIANAPVYNVYSSTNITTSAYVQLIASTSNATNIVDIFDSSGQAMILGVGGSGSEVVQYYVPPGGDTFTLAIPAGSRVAYKALTGNATSGYLLVNLLQ